MNPSPETRCLFYVYLVGECPFIICIHHNCFHTLVLVMTNSENMYCSRTDMVPEGNSHNCKHCRKFTTPKIAVPIGGHQVYCSY